jgi:hypothetical protein
MSCPSKATFYLGDEVVAEGQHSVTGYVPWKEV